MVKWRACSNSVGAVAPNDDGPVMNEARWSGTTVCIAVALSAWTRRKSIRPVLPANGV